MSRSRGIADESHHNLPNTANVACTAHSAQRATSRMCRWGFSSSSQTHLTFWACSCHLRTRAAFALVQCVHVTSCHRRLCFAPIQARNTAHVMQEQSVAKRTAAFAPSKLCFSAFCGEAVLVAAAMCTLAYICASVCVCACHSVFV